MIRSLRARLAFGAAAGVTIVVLVAGVALLAIARRDQYDVLDDELTRRARVLAGISTRVARGQDVPLLQIAVDLEGDIVVRVEEGDAALFDSRGADATSWPDVERGYHTVDVDGRDWRVYRVPVTEIAEPPEQLQPDTLDLEVALPIAPTEDAVHTLRRRVLVVGGAAVVVAGVIGWLVGSVTLRPLGRLRTAAERVAATNDLSVRADPGGAPPEIASVTKSLNVMLERLEETAGNERTALETSRSFAANVTHELRTPLTSLRTNVDLLGHPSLAESERADVLAEARRAVARVADLLTALEVLARGDLVREVQRERVDLTALVDAAVEETRRRHPDAEITMRAGTDAPDLRGWPEGLRVLVDNLLENAAVHGAHSGAAAQVDVSVSGRDGTAVIVVDDRGPGIAPRDRERILGPFERGADATAPGSGLGLAIVDQQVRIHGGTLTIDGNDAGGTRVTVVLPADTEA